MFGRILFLVGLAVLIVGLRYKTTSLQLTQTGSLPQTAVTVDNRIVNTGGSIPQYGQVEMPDAGRQNTRNIIVFCGIVLAVGGVATQVFKRPA